MFRFVFQLMGAFDLFVPGRNHFLLSKRSLSFNNVMITMTSAPDFISFQCFEVHNNLLHKHFAHDPVGFELSSVLCFHLSFCK